MSKLLATSKQAKNQNTPMGPVFGMAYFATKPSPIVSYSDIDNAVPEAHPTFQCSNFADFVKPTSFKKYSSSTLSQQSKQSTEYEILREIAPSTDRESVLDQSNNSFSKNADACDVSLTVRGILKEKTKSRFSKQIDPADINNLKKSIRFSQ